MRGNPRRCQAENPLIVLFKFPEPALFDAASELIAGFELLDSTVAASIDSKTKTLIVLEDVQSGSLRVLLKNVLKRVDDEALKSLEWKKAGPHLLEQSMSRSNS